MSQVKRWYIGVYGGEAQARTCSPFPHEVIRDSEGDTFVLSRDHNAALAREASLQQRLTAADERADVLEGLLRELFGAGSFESSALEFDNRDGHEWYARISAAFRPAEGGGDE